MNYLNYFNFISNISKEKLVNIYYPLNDLLNSEFMRLRAIRKKNKKDYIEYYTLLKKIVEYYDLNKRHLIYRSEAGFIMSQLSKNWKKEHGAYYHNKNDVEETYIKFEESHNLENKLNDLHIMICNEINTAKNPIKHFIRYIIKNLS